MKEFNSVDDVLDFAIDNEVRANQFYLDLADKMDRQAMKQVFLDFAGEEKRHEEMLIHVKEGHKLDSAGEAVRDLKIGDYLVNITPTADMTYQDALILAMKREKAAFMLYRDLATKVNDENMIRLFNNLANEEAKHKLYFEVEYDENVQIEN